MKTEELKAITLFEKAEKHYFGHTNIEVNYPKAFGFYSKALELGEVRSYLMLGRMLRDGDGVEIDKKEAHELFLAGIENEIFACHAEMAISFLEADNLKEAISSWTSYFEQTEATELETFYAFLYIKMIYQHELRLRFIDKLNCNKNSILDFAEDVLNIKDENEEVDEETLLIQEYIYTTLEDTSYDCNPYLNYEEGFNYKYGLEGFEMDFEFACKRFEKTFELIRFNEYEQYLCKYYIDLNLSNDFLHFNNYLDFGIANGDVECYGAKAINYQNTSNPDFNENLALLNWGIYFEISKENINPLFALEYILFISITDNNLEHKESLIQLKPKLLEMIDLISQDAEDTENHLEKNQLMNFVGITEEFINKKLKDKNLFESLLENFMG